MSKQDQSAEPTKKPKPVPFMLRLDPELHEWLKGQAQQHDRSINYLINAAVRAYKKQREI